MKRLILAFLLTAGCTLPQRLDPELAAPIQAAFDDAGIDYDVRRVTHVVWDDRLWDALHRNKRNAAFVWGEQINHAASFIPDWRTARAHRQGWGHEVFHCYEFHSEGDLRATTRGFLCEGVAAMIAGGDWWDQPREVAAIEFGATVK